MSDVDLLEWGYWAEEVSAETAVQRVHVDIPLAFNKCDLAASSTHDLSAAFDIIDYETSLAVLRITCRFDNGGMLVLILF